MIGLQAELSKATVEFQQQRNNPSLQKPRIKSVKKSSNVFARKNSGVNERCHRDSVAIAEESYTEDKARNKLLKKAKIYDSIKAAASRGEIIENVDGVLVDFNRKAFEEDDKKHDEEHHQPFMHPSRMPAHSNRVTNNVNVNHGSSYDDDNKLVDYTDSLGRTRQVRQSELPQLIAMDDRDKEMTCNDRRKRELSPVDGEGEATAISNGWAWGDGRGNMNGEWKPSAPPQHYDDDEEEIPIGPVHFADIEGSEIRDKGVGYYALSQNKDLRAKQLKELDDLHKDTLMARQKEQEMQEKKRAATADRLRKIKERRSKQRTSNEKNTEELTSVAPEMIDECKITNDDKEDDKEDDSEFQSQLRSMLAYTRSKCANDGVNHQRKE